MSEVSAFDEWAVTKGFTIKLGETADYLKDLPFDLKNSKTVKSVLQNRFKVPDIDDLAMEAMLQIRKIIEWHTFKGLSVGSSEQALLIASVFSDGVVTNLIKPRGGLEAFVKVGERIIQIPFTYDPNNNPQNNEILLIHPDTAAKENLSNQQSLQLLEIKPII